MREAIEDEIKRKEAEKLKEDIERLKPVFDKVSMEEIVKSIRKDRTSK